MRQTPDTAELSAALAKAQGAFVNPEKDREVAVHGETKTGKPFNYTFRYATFTAIVDSVRKPLADNGLSFVQTITYDPEWNGHLVTTRLQHASGQWLEFDTPVFVGGPGAQAFGSGVTYAKRYALSTLLGVTADEDDDGSGSEGNKVDMRQRPSATPKPQQRPAQASAPAPNGQTSAIGADVRREAAETYVSQAIEGFAKMKHQDALTQWWKANAKQLEKLEANHGGLFERLCTVADEMRERLPHTTQAA